MRVWYIALLYWETNVADQETQHTSEKVEEHDIVQDIQQDEVNVDANDNALHDQIEQLTQALATAKEDAIRAAAEAQNARRRAQQDVEKAHKFALEKFVNDMLPVADNLERAVESSKADGVEMATVVEGVELTLKTLIDGLKKHSVEAVNPEGEPFDPQLHQAMSMIEQPDVEPNTVLNVFQQGYTLNGRLVRPAMVVVSKS